MPDGKQLIGTTDAIYTEGYKPADFDQWKDKRVKIAYDKDKGKIIVLSLA